MKNCLFCKIIAGEIPSKKVFENDNVYAFEDIEPQAPFHVIVIPKQHISSCNEITKENSQNIAAIFEAITEIARENKLENGYRVVTNCGKDAGQTVGHLHFHILARRNLEWPPG